MSLVAYVELQNEVKRHLVEHLAGQQSHIGEQVVLAIRSSGEISNSKRLTDQQLIDHFPRLFADLIEAIRSEMLDICERNVLEMSELLTDLKDYSALIAGATPLQIEEIDAGVFGSELEASFHAMTQTAGVHLI